MQKPAAEKIKELGYELIVSDMNPDCVCAHYADHFVKLSTFDVAAHLEVAEKLRAEFEIKAVLTTGADCHETVAAIADFLQLPGVNPELSKNCRFKDRTRKILTEAGLPQPAFQVVHSHGEAMEAAATIGLPVVLKASDNSASRGFSKIEKLEDLSVERFDDALNAGSTGYVLVEKLLKPTTNELAELSIETLWYKGKMLWLNWVDRLFRNDLHFFPFLETSEKNRDFPWAIELGHLNPAQHSESLRQELENMIYKAGIAMGLEKEKDGFIFKADIFLTDQGPIILELTPRLSGGWDSSKTTPLRGADFIGGAIQLALGKTASEDLIQKYFSFGKGAAFAAILCDVHKDAKDCTYRSYAAGAGEKLEEALEDALKNLNEKNYL
ncbi:MAG: hypothetical protein AAB802_01425 [Patescibacteria group bacterium]